MTKQQKKQVEMIKLHAAAGNQGAAARGLSALIRAAMTSKQREGLLAEAEALGLTNNPDFIV